MNPLSPKRPILNGKVNFPVCLAPMVGLTHVAFRRMLREYLPKDAVTIWPTEMLNSRRLPKEDLIKTPETMRDASETELVPQILGNEAEPIELSVRRLQDEWGAEGIDINMGCPVKKALSHNYGVALMGDADYAAEVVRMTVKSSRVPVSVKLRAGHQNDIDYLLKFTRGLQDAGASWITLHPRTTEQKRRGSADWSQIRTVRESLSIPVIGNGDVQTVEDVENLQAETGCDMVMVGRALTARPWLYWQLGEKLGFAPPAGREGERAPQGELEEGAEYGRSLLRLLDYCEQHFKEELALRKFRFFVKTGAHWLLFGHDLYARTTKAKTFIEMRKTIEDFFSRPQPMSARTDLRQ
ncbi:MAG TPA: tRNA-dihydrouridine synthase family protein [Bdellovibrionales bacterium]|nr:tRNA-dihydrouridine synthase family protein [Bdellovibrionales bacterium]